MDKYNPFIAATLLTDNIGWFSKPIKLPIKFTQEIIETKIAYFLRRAHLVQDIMTVVPDAVDRCTIYLFIDKNDIDRLSRIQVPDTKSSENKMLIAEVMASVYRVFADEVFEPKEYIDEGPEDMDSDNKDK